MQCREVRDLLDSFLGQELLVETNHEVLHHLAGCPDCRSELEARTRLRSGLQRAFRNSPELQMRPELATALVAHLRSTATTRRARQWSRGALALAASLALAAAAGVYFAIFSDGSAPQLARLAAGDHQNCAVSFRLAERPISLEDAAARYDSAYAQLKNIPSDTVTTDAGVLRVVDRHSCVFDGVRFGHVVLRLDDHLVSVLMTAPVDSPGAAAPDGLTWLPSTDGFSMASLRTSAHTIFIVSDLPDASFRQVAASLANPVSSLASLIWNISGPAGD
jgi:hypothetical protein